MAVQIVTPSGEHISLNMETTEPVRRPLSEAMRKAGLSLRMPCGGAGRCGKCRVRYLTEPPAPDPEEIKKLSEDELASGVRLTCRSVPKEDAVIEMPPETWSILSEGRPAKPEQYHLVLNSERAKMKTGSSEDDTEGLPRFLRLGIAIDLGTTTLAAALMDLDGGIGIAFTDAVNPQVVFGADVLTRMERAKVGERTALEDALLDGIRGLVEALLIPARVHTVGISTPEKKEPAEIEALLTRCKESCIERIVFCGNTVITHFLREISTDPLSEAPFQNEAASGLCMNFDGIEILILPTVSAFLGGDLLAGAYATSTGFLARELSDPAESVLLVDLGTNGELLLRTPEGIFAASASAGPAFEGGGLSCGMAMEPGAVNHVRVIRDRTDLKTFGGLPAKGICGSGALEALAELRRNGWIDARGTLKEPWHEEGFLLQKGRGQDRDLRMTQEDIRQLQLAKGAIRAGIELLFREAGIARPDRILLAGSFGLGLSTKAAEDIGLLPRMPGGSVQAAGNTALEGAMRLLCDSDPAESIRELEAYAKEIRVVSLAGHPDFQEQFLAYMDFPE